MKIGFDLDRVLFDTNSYFESINARLKKKNTSIDKIFHGTSGRKDLDTLYNILYQRFGKNFADRTLLLCMKAFTSQKLQKLIEDLKKRGHEVYIVSVGGRYQKKKAEFLPQNKVYVVGNDTEKVRVAEELKLDYFFDDKIVVVEMMQNKGINAFQALWYLDEDRQKNAHQNALVSINDVKTLLTEGGVI